MDLIELFIGNTGRRETLHPDSVFVRDVEIQAHVGPDAWGRSKPQPLKISASIPFSVRAAGMSDSIEHTLDYRQVYKVIRNLDAPDCSLKVKHYAHVMELAEAVCDGLPYDDAIRIDITAPKAMLHTDGITLRYWKTKLSGNDWPVTETSGAVIAIRNMHIPCIIGIGEHERLQKQPVIVNLVIHALQERQLCPIIEKFRDTFDIFEKSQFLTLEAFATAFSRHVLFDLNFSAVALNAYKPSVFGMADGPGVQIFRNKEFFERESTA